jgi:hypothetical protein
MSQQKILCGLQTTRGTCVEGESDIGSARRMMDNCKETERG